jgi:hypothetical protein
MLTIKVKNSVKFPEITLQEDLEHIAERIIIPDIQAGIDNSFAINGGSLPPNEPETIKRKGHSRQLIDTGTLRRSFFWKTLSKNKVIVSVDGDRKDIGGYLQDGIIAKGKLKQYLFFGISKDAFDGAIKYMEKRIKELTSGGSER